MLLLGQHRLRNKRNLTAKRYISVIYGSDSSDTFL